MSYNAKNYFADGGDTLHIGGKLEFEQGTLMPNQAAQSGTGGSDAKASINALLIKLKNAGLMAGDEFTLTVTKDVVDSVEGHADRQYNTGKISAVSESDGVITITLSDKVKNLKDFDGGNGWGVHKWLGIGVNAGVGAITNLKYNGSTLTAEDISEATTCGLSTGYFVRWVAADLVLAGNDKEKSKGSFKLWADGYAETEYRFVIIEPS